MRPEDFRKKKFSYQASVALYFFAALKAKRVTRYIKDTKTITTI